MRRVRGIVQHYAWGDTSALPALLDIAPDGRPWAEVWFGTHPSGTSSVAAQDRSAGTTPTSLLDIAGPLPFMVKLLAAASPLSLQTHPSQEQAEKGFAAENVLGIPLGSGERLYGDPSAKPELLIALTPFQALCGVRPLDATDELLRDIGGAAARLADRLASDGIAATIADHLIDRRPTFALVEACRRSTRPEARLVLDLERRHPADPAVAISLLLNLVTLRPGQAIYLTPGNLHAYIEGTGVEVMGSSDNVIRGGLTNKQVAVDELMNVLDPTPLETPRAPMAKVQTGLWRYVTPNAPFVVYAEHIAGPTTIHAHTRELVLCAVGSTDLLHTGEVAYLAPGEELTLDGTATVFRSAEA